MNTKKLIRIMVLFSLLGFLGISVYVFYFCIKNESDIKGPVIYVYNILNGLVGGIFALAFGLPAPTEKKSPDRMVNKIHSLSGMMSEEDPSDKLGYFYALSYMIVGFVAVGIWLFSSSAGACEYIVSFAQIFLGMLVAIVTGYFKD
ncbi:MAG: hypothetical protein IPN49_15085 [Saprospiraceae bacterium]|nr:hypothetical protein [Saprospiraceae bacterium]MBK8820343.1 hypothetical protein [Saprospiraceae bacterium]MBP6695947.1 hypothetical protein [Saprospiraceae bacterium]